MHDSIVFIQDLAIIMIIAGVMTVLCHHFKQPVVLGYILSGIIIGPYTPPFSFINNEMTIKTLADLGVIFLMFSLGLEFNLHKLRKVGLPALIAALSEIILMIWAGYEIGRWFGWSPINSLFLGSMLAISSTTIIVKALEELGIKKERFAQLIFGILIIEDIFAIAILALLSTVATTGSFSVSDILLALTKLLSFIVMSLLIGILTVPKLLTYIAKFNNKEMLLISVLGLCFGFCLLVMKLEYSVALGAFVIGAIIAESRQFHLIEHLTNPLKDMFSAIFFVSVGLLFNPKVFVDYSGQIAIITIVVIVGKVLTCSLGTLISGKDGRTAMRVGMGLAQIGEFSFIIATLGISLKVTDYFLYPIAVAVSAITTLLTPYLIYYSDSIARYISAFLPKKVGAVFANYQSLLANIHPDKVQTHITKIITRSLYQILINLLIVMGIFLASDYVALTWWGKTVEKVMGEYLEKAIIWGGALIISSPFLIAVYRKIKVLLILAELRSKKLNNPLTIKIRKIISEIIPIGSLLAFLMFVSIFSINILPPMKLLILMLIISLGIISLLFRWLIKFHIRLQIYLLKSMRKKERE